MKAAAWGTPDQMLDARSRRAASCSAPFELATSFRFGGIPYEQGGGSRCGSSPREVLPVLKKW